MHDKLVIFDTNRLWCARLPTLVTLFPDAKFICTVRNVAWIMESLERLIRGSPFENTRLFGTTRASATPYSAGSTRSPSVTA